PTQEPLPLKTNQASIPSNASASAPELIDPMSLVQPRHRVQPAPSPRPARLRRRSGLLANRLLGLVGGVAILGAVAYFGAWIPWAGSSNDGSPLLSEVRKATLRITVTERGNLESCVTVDGICEVNANQIKIISLVPEGTKVKKGEIVCKF